MPSKPPRPCTRTGCGNKALNGSGRCAGHYTQARKHSDVKRGTASQRGYGSTHRVLFRDAVLQRDPICVLCDNAASTVADHWPLSRRDLVAKGLDPNDPFNGRGLCKPCHDRHTAEAQPGYRFGSDY